MNLPTQKNEKEINNEHKLSNNNDNNNIFTQTEKKLNFLEMKLKFSNKINIDYSNFDFQKGECSPKFLFRKRKFEDGEIKQQQNHTKEERINNNNNVSKNGNYIEDTSN
jgi:hypothetical protein